MVNVSLWLRFPLAKPTQMALCREETEAVDLGLTVGGSAESFWCCGI